MKRKTVLRNQERRSRRMALVLCGLFLCSAVMAQTSFLGNPEEETKDNPPLAAGEVGFSYYLSIKSNVSTTFTIYLPVMVLGENGTVVSEVYDDLDHENATFDIVETEKGQALKVEVKNNFSTGWIASRVRGDEYYYNITPTLINERTPVDPFDDFSYYLKTERLEYWIYIDILQENISIDIFEAIQIGINNPHEGGSLFKSYGVRGGGNITKTGWQIYHNAPHYEEVLYRGSASNEDSASFFLPAFATPVLITTTAAVVIFMKKKRE